MIIVRNYLCRRAFVEKVLSGCQGFFAKSSDISQILEVVGAILIGFSHIFISTDYPISHKII